MNCFQPGEKVIVPDGRLGEVDTYDEKSDKYRVSFKLGWALYKAWELEKMDGKT